MHADMQKSVQRPYSSKKKHEQEEWETGGWDMAKLQASINNDIPNYKRRLPETFNQFQNIVIDLKDEVRIIKKRINGMNVLMIILSVILSIICQMNLYK